MSVKQSEILDSECHGKTVHEEREEEGKDSFFDFVGILPIKGPGAMLCHWCIAFSLLKC